MASDETTEETSARQQSKVARLVREYGLNGTGDELVARWTGQGEQQRSLRELADYLNQELLRATMEGAGMSPLDGEVENYYRLLTDESTSAGNEVEAETALQHAGVAVDELRRNFVSHQAVHTYLTKHRDVEWESRRTGQERVENTVDTVRRLQNRLTAVSKQNLQALCDKDLISLGDFSVLVDVRVLCENCGKQRDVVDMLADGGCDCER